LPIAQSPRTSSKEHELITLLLEEHKSLRTEIIQRLATRGQALGLTAALSALIVTSDHSPFSWVLAGLVLVLGFIFWFGSNRAILYLADHVRELERRINGLTRDAYGATEDALTWETRYHHRRMSSGPWSRLVRRSVGWR
jgi:hypothetical protein